MKLNTFTTIIASTFLSPNLFANIDNTHHFSNDITLYCSSDCNPETVVDHYIEKRRYLHSAEQRITVEYRGTIIFESTVENYFLNKLTKERILKSQGKSAVTYDKKGNVVFKRPRELTKKSDPWIMDEKDAPLSCEYDTDYTCEEWNYNESLAELVEHINNTSLTIPVTQNLINGCTDAANIGASLILASAAIPVTTVLLSTTSANILAQNIIAWGVAGASWEIADTVSELLCGDLQPGDTLHIQGGVITIISGQDGGSGGINDDDYYDPNPDININNYGGGELVCGQYTVSANGDSNSYLFCYFV